MPQSQTAANPRHQKEEKKEEEKTHTKKKKNTRKPNKEVYEKHKDQLPLPQARWSECLNGETRTKSTRKLESIKRSVV